MPHCMHVGIFLPPGVFMMMSLKALSLDSGTRVSFCIFITLEEMTRRFYNIYTYLLTILSGKEVAKNHTFINDYGVSYKKMLLKSHTTEMFNKKENPV